MLWYECTLADVSMRRRIVTDGWVAFTEPRKPLDIGYWTFDVRHLKAYGHIPNTLLLKTFK